jgi:hypothetical protein
VLLDGLTALGFAEMFAVRREPRERDRSAFANIDWVCTPDRLAKMLSARMVCTMHRNRFGVVVDGNIDRSAERSFDACGRPSASGEVVDDESVEWHILVEFSPRGVSEFIGK